MKYELKKVCLIKEDDSKEILAKRLAIADTFWSRFKGLIGKKKMVSGCALLLYPCSSVHTFFMRFPIDVVYLDKDMNILKVVKDMKPWRVDFGHKKARYVLELPAKTISESKGKIVIEDV